MTEPPWPPQLTPQVWSPSYPGVDPLPLRRRNGLGITSLVFGIVSLALCWVPFVGVGLGVCAVVTGAIGRRRITRGEADDNGPTVIGILLGVAAILIGAVIGLLVVVIVFFHHECLEQAQYPYQRKGC